MHLKEWIRSQDAVNQEDMADSLGITREYFNGIANRRNRPSPDLAKRIEEATGGKVTRMELLYPGEKEVVIDGTSQDATCRV